MDSSAWPAISLYYTLFSFTTILLISLSGILTSINRIVSILSIIAFTSIVSSVILGMLSEKVRDRSIVGLPGLSLQPKKIEKMDVKTYASNRHHYETSKSEYYSRPTGQRLNKYALPETVSSREVAQGRPSRQNVVMVDGQVISDRDYIRYSKWCEENYRWHVRLTYSEFLKIRETVSKILSTRLLDGDSEIGIPDLSILVRISLREDLKDSTAWAEAIKKLNRFGLVSRNCKLMPRGVKIVKALKEVGLLEKIAGQTG